MVPPKAVLARSAKFGCFDRVEVYSRLLVHPFSILTTFAASSVPPSNMLLSAVVQVYMQSPDSLIPKVASMVVDKLPVVQLHGLVDCGPAQIRRLVSHWRHAYPVATRWVDSTSVIICCDSLVDLRT
ncbi:hypothetical protein BVRB_028390, partial [Beta vulgaris subsp. vulgaris]